MDQGANQPAFSLCQLGAVTRVDGNVAEGGGAVVLNIDIGRREQLDEYGDCAGVYQLLSVVVWYRVSIEQELVRKAGIPECVMLSSAPVAFLWTRMSFDFARRVRGWRAPDRAILALLSSWVARLVMHPTALHCTSTLGEFICLIRGARPPRATMATLFSAAGGVRRSLRELGRVHTVDGKIAQGGTGGTLYLDIWVLQQEQDGLEGVAVDFSYICVKGG